MCPIINNSKLLVHRPLSTPISSDSITTFEFLITSSWRMAPEISRFLFAWKWLLLITSSYWCGLTFKLIYCVFSCQSRMAVCSGVTTFTVLINILREWNLISIWRGFIIFRSAPILRRRWRRGYIGVYWLAVNAFCFVKVCWTHGKWSEVFIALLLRKAYLILGRRVSCNQ